MLLLHSDLCCYYAKDRGKTQRHSFLIIIPQRGKRRGKRDGTVTYSGQDQYSS
jgi:hypothetical protein